MPEKVYSGVFNYADSHGYVHFSIPQLPKNLAPSGGLGDVVSKNGHNHESQHCWKPPSAFFPAISYVYLILFFTILKTWMASLCIFYFSCQVRYLEVNEPHIMSH